MRLRHRLLQAQRGTVAGGPRGDAVGTPHPRPGVQAFRPSGKGEQREPRQQPRSVFPTTQRTAARSLDERSHTRGEPLVPRTRDLPTQRFPHQQSTRHRAHRLRPVWRGEHPPSGGTALRGYPCPTGVHPTMGTYRRQPRVGRGMGRRPLVFPRSLRTRTGAQPGMVQRECLAWHADAHQGLRRLRRSGGGDEPHTLLYGNQCHRQLCPHCHPPRQGDRCSRTPRGRCPGRVQTLQLR